MLLVEDVAWQAARSAETATAAPKRVRRSRNLPREDPGKLMGSVIRLRYRGTLETSHWHKSVILTRRLPEWREPHRNGERILDTVSRALQMRRPMDRNFSARALRTSS